MYLLSSGIRYTNINQTRSAAAFFVLIRRTVYISFVPNLKLVEKVSGKSTKYCFSVSFIGESVGGNQNDDQTWTIAGDYLSKSQMLNIGFDDFHGGAYKDTTFQIPVMRFPRWLGFLMWYF